MGILGFDSDVLFSCRDFDLRFAETVAAVRLFDVVIRGAPRDALIADVTPAPMLGPKP